MIGFEGQPLPAHIDWAQAFSQGYTAWRIERTWWDRLCPSQFERTWSEPDTTKLRFDQRLLDYMQCNPEVSVTEAHEAVDGVLIDAAHAYLSESQDFALVRPIFLPSLEYLAVWQGAEALPWHQDTDDAVEWFIIFYDTDISRWDPNMGGHFQVARADLASPNLLIPEVDETTIQSLYPSHRAAVLFNNHRLDIAHRAMGLKEPDQKRVLLQLGLNFKPNPKMRSL